MTGNGSDIANTVRDAIYRATIYLDEGKWEQWLGLCDDGFEYAIRSFSPEINKDMTYLQHNRKGLETMVRLLPKHNTDHSGLRRHTSVYTVDVGADGTSARAVSSFVVFQNLLDGENSHIDAGESRLYILGRYIDEFKIDGGTAKFVKREVRLDNRRFDKGTHYPI